MNPADLLAALGAVPALPGARCRNRHELFDLAGPDADPDNREYAQNAALALCRTCPALAGCQQWFDGLKPSQRPIGVTAGRVVAEPRQRKRRAS